MKKLEKILCYSFKDINILKLALTHRSIGNKNNERLEFLGDSILELVISEELFIKFPDINEGDLSRLRANLVCAKMLAKIAKKIDLSNFLILGKGELRSAGFRKESILSDTMEAIIGAIFIDSNYTNVKKVLLHIYKDIFLQADKEEISKDFKTQLQELLQKKKSNLPIYKLLKISGKDHDSDFYVECILTNEKLCSQGVAKSIKDAEQICAKLILKKIKDEF